MDLPKTLDQQPPTMATEDTDSETRDSSASSKEHLDLDPLSETAAIGIDGASPGLSATLQEHTDLPSLPDLALATEDTIPVTRDPSATLKEHPNLQSLPEATITATKDSDDANPSATLNEHTDLPSLPEPHMAIKDSDSPNGESSAALKEHTDAPSLSEGTTVEKNKAPSLDFSFYLVGEYGVEDPESALKWLSESIEKSPETESSPVSESSSELQLSPNAIARHLRIARANELEWQKHGKDGKFDLSFLYGDGGDDIEVESLWDYLARQSPLCEDGTEDLSHLPDVHYPASVYIALTAQLADGNSGKSALDRALDELDDHDEFDQTPCPPSRRQRRNRFLGQVANAFDRDYTIRNRQPTAGESSAVGGSSATRGNYAGAVGRFDAISPPPDYAGAQDQATARDDSADAEGETDDGFGPALYAGTNSQHSASFLREEYDEFDAEGDARQDAINFSGTPPYGQQNQTTEDDPFTDDKENDNPLENSFSDSNSSTLSPDGEHLLNNNLGSAVPTDSEAHGNHWLNENYDPDIPLPSIERDESPPNDGSPLSDPPSSSTLSHSTQNDSGTLSHGGTRNESVGMHNQSPKPQTDFQVSNSEADDKSGQEASADKLLENINDEYYLPGLAPSFPQSDPVGSSQFPVDGMDWVSDECSRLGENDGPPIPPYDPLAENLTPEEENQEAARCLRTAKAIFLDDLMSGGDWLDEDMLHDYQNTKIGGTGLGFVMEDEANEVMESDVNGERIQSSENNANRLFAALHSSHHHTQATKQTDSFSETRTEPQHNLAAAAPTGKLGTGLSELALDSSVYGQNTSPHIANGLSTTHEGHQDGELGFEDEKPQPIPSFQGGSPGRWSRSPVKKKQKSTKEVFNAVRSQQPQMGRQFMNSESPDKRGSSRPRNQPSQSPGYPTRDYQEYAPNIPDNSGFLAPPISQGMREQSQSIPRDLNSTVSPDSEGAEYRNQGYVQNIPNSQSSFARPFDQRIHGGATQGHQEYPSNVPNNRQFASPSTSQGMGYPMQGFQGYAPNPHENMNIQGGQAGYQTQSYQEFASNSNSMGSAVGHGLEYQTQEYHGHAANLPTNMPSMVGQGAGYQTQGYQGYASNLHSNMTSMFGQGAGYQTQGYQGHAANLPSNITSTVGHGPESQPSNMSSATGQGMGYPAQGFVAGQGPGNPVPGYYQGLDQRVSSNMHTVMSHIMGQLQPAVAPPLSSQFTSIPDQVPGHLMHSHQGFVLNHPSYMNSVAGQGLENATQSHQGSPTIRPDDNRSLSGQDIYRTQQRYDGFPPIHPHGTSFSTSSTGQGNGSVASAPQNHQEDFDNHALPPKARWFQNGDNYALTDRGAPRSGFDALGNGGEQAGQSQYRRGNSQPAPTTGNNTVQHGQMFTGCRTPTQRSRTPDLRSAGSTIEVSSRRMPPRGDENGSPVADEVRRQNFPAIVPERPVGNQERPVFNPRPLLPRSVSQSPKTIDDSPIKLQFPALTPKPSTREKAVIVFRGHKECAIAQNTLQNAIKADPGRGIMFTETFENKPQTIIISAPAGSMLRAWVKDLLPHARVDMSMN